jgi:hypothetical protein
VRSYINPVDIHNKPWCFIVDGDLNEAQQHTWGIDIGGSWWCAGCLAALPKHYTTEPENWPHMAHAPNGLRLTMTRLSNVLPRDIARRPLCPGREATT